MPPPMRWLVPVACSTPPATGASVDDERRQHPRVKVPKILVRIPSVEKLWAYLPDLSEGGIFVRAEKLLPLDSEVDIELLPPGADRPLNLHGKVVRHQNDDAARAKGQVGMGIRFSDLSAEDEERISSLVSEYPKTKNRGDAEADRFRLQLQGVVMELGNVREELQARERDLETVREQLQETHAQLSEAKSGQAQATARATFLEQELSRRPVSLGSSGQPDESPALRREIAELKTLLAESQGKSQALEQDLSQFEQDEAQSRALAERLAADKTKLEKQRKEDNSRSAVELERLRAEVDATTQVVKPQLDEARSRADKLERELKTERAARSELEGALGMERSARAEAVARAELVQRSLDETRHALTGVGRMSDELRAAQNDLDLLRAKAAGHDRQLSDVKAQLERSKAKERDLRRLLAAVSSPSGDGDDGLGGVTEETELPPEPARPATPPPVSRARTSELEASVAAAAAAEPDAPAASTVPPPPAISAAAHSAQSDDAEVVMFDLDFDAGASSPKPPLTESPHDGAKEKEKEAAPPSPDEAPPPAAKEPAPPALNGEGVHSTMQFGIPPELARPPQGVVNGVGEHPSDDLDLSDLDSVSGPNGAHAAAIQQAPIPLVQAVSPARNGSTPKPPRVSPFANMDDLPIPAGASPAAAATSARKIAEFDEFKRRLTGGDRIDRTEKFSLFTATEPAEVLVTSWLERADTMDELCKLADGRLGPNRIARVVFDLYNRALIDFRR